MTDLQSTHKNFLFEIEEVGIKNLVYPVKIDHFKQQVHLVSQQV